MMRGLAPVHIGSNEVLSRGAERRDTTSCAPYQSEANIISRRHASHAVDVDAKVDAEVEVEVEIRAEVGVSVEKDIGPSP